eukprot:gene5728-9551_t
MLLMYFVIGFFLLLILYYLFHQHLFAWLLNKISNHPRKFKEIKRDLFSEVKNEILEIGCGTGINFEFLAENKNIKNWIGIEPNPQMNSFLEKNKKKFNVQFNTKIENISAENMTSIPDESVDYVIGSHIFCSISYFQTQNVLKEISRILKKNGKFIFVEHVADPKNSFTRYVQIFISPLWFVISDGCRFAKTWNVFQEAKENFSALVVDHFDSNLIPFGLTVVKPHIKGYFIK